MSAMLPANPPNRHDLAGAGICPPRTLSFFIQGRIPE